MKVRYASPGKVVVPHRLTKRPGADDQGIIEQAAMIGLAGPARHLADLFPDNAADVVDDTVGAMWDAIRAWDAVYSPAALVVFDDTRLLALLQGWITYQRHDMDWAPDYPAARVAKDLRRLADVETYAKKLRAAIDAREVAA